MVFNAKEVNELDAGRDCAAPKEEMCGPRFWMILTGEVKICALCVSEAYQSGGR